MPNVEPLREGDPAAVGPYRLVGRLGAGGHGVVYLGQARNGTPVAVKVLREGPAGDDRLAKAIAAARRVEPFCLAQVLDASTSGRPYIVAEYVDGPSLQESGRLGGAELQRLAVATATALDALHQADVLHLDLKPGNVILGPDGARVVDFGIAEAFGQGMSATGAIMGTPAYMAPEQLAGETAGAPADVFAWASLIVFAAGGVPPFGDDSLPAVINRILREEPRIGELPRPLAEVVTACLAKNPAARPAMRDVLLRLLGGERPGRLPRRLSDEEYATPAAPERVPAASAAPPSSPDTASDLHRRSNAPTLDLPAHGTAPGAQDGGATPTPALQNRGTTPTPALQNRGTTPTPALQDRNAAARDRALGFGSQVSAASHHGAPNHGVPNHGAPHHGASDHAQARTGQAARRDPAEVAALHHGAGARRAAAAWQHQAGFPAAAPAAPAEPSPPAGRPPGTPPTGTRPATEDGPSPSGGPPVQHSALVDILVAGRPGTGAKTTAKRSARRRVKTALVAGVSGVSVLALAAAIIWLTPTTPTPKAENAAGGNGAPTSQAAPTRSPRPERTRTTRPTPQTEGTPSAVPTADATTTAGAQRLRIAAVRANGTRNGDCWAGGQVTLRALVTRTGGPLTFRYTWLVDGTPVARSAALIAADGRRYLAPPRPLIGTAGGTHRVTLRITAPVLVQRSIVVTLCDDV